MEIDLSHRTAVVTGSTAGIGFAIAQGLAGCGATVVLNGRTANSVEDAIARLKRLAPRATIRIRSPRIQCSGACSTSPR